MSPLRKNFFQILRVTPKNNGPLYSGFPQNGTLFLVIIFWMLAFLASCKEIKESDLVGYWRLNANIMPAEFYEINFSEDGEIRLLDFFSFIQTGQYRIDENNQLILFLTNGEKISTSIEMPGSDSLVMFDSLPYFRIPSEYEFETTEPFELIGIKTNQTYNYKDNENLFCLFSLFQSSDGEIRVRVGEDNIRIPNLHLDLAEKSNCEILIFIGEEVGLTDLRELYLQLAAHDRDEVVLALNKLNGEYFVIQDSIFVWSEELEKYLADKKLVVKKPLLIDKFLKADFLKKKNVELINFDSSSTLDFLKEFDIQKEYVISIDCHTDFTRFIDLKMELNRIESASGIRIKTEIDCSN